MFTRKIFGTLFVASLAVLGFGTSAQAATDITRGGSCSLSANWTVNTSANFNNTSGSPSTGYLDYVVMSSPGALQASGSSWKAYNSAGSLVGSSFFWSYEGIIGGKYTYRSDPNQLNIRFVRIDPKSNTGVFCSDYSSYSQIYSAN